jgi:hypothetical protein
MEFVLFCLLERLSRNWLDHSTIDPREIGWCGVDWIALAQDWDSWTDLVDVGSVKCW